MSEKLNEMRTIGIDQIHALNEKYGEHAKKYISASAIATVMFYGLSMLLWINFLVVAMVLGILTLTAYILFKESMDEDDARAITKLMFLQAAFLIAFLIATPFLSVSKNVGLVNMARTLALIFGFIGIMGAFVFCISDTGKKLAENIASFTPNFGNSEPEKKPGDIILCLDKEATDAAKKPVYEILPYKDRFLHMLALGPTGSGKTSQILLPMINQDIQNPEMGVTVIEPKGDFAQQAAMIADHYGRPYVYFDPSIAGCPFFNPLVGPEAEVMENMATTFRMLNPNSPQYFLDQDEQLIRYAVKVLKRLDASEGVDGKWSTFINLGRLLQNSGSQGREIINRFRTIAAPTEDEGKENFDIAAWFLNDYFAERSKVYQDTSELRSQVAKINSSKYLRSVLNPDISRGETNQIDFDKHLAEGGVICISTAQGLLGNLGTFLGYFIILQFQSAVFRRPGNENTRRPHALYIDEFQTYSTPGFGNMLTQGRSYRVACILATQNRALMAMGGGKDGKNFVELVSTNARNIVVFPGGNSNDAKYYSDQFGEIKKTEEMKSISRKRFNLITGGLDKLGHPSESIRIQTKTVAAFSPSDIIHREFGEVVYCIIKNNSIQRAKVGKIQFIPKDLHDDIDQRWKAFEAAHQFSEEEPKSGTEVVWEDGSDPDFVDDLLGGEEYVPIGPPEEEAPEVTDIIKELKSTRPPAPEPVYDPKAAAEPKPEELEWDLLDTIGNPEDGFGDDDDDPLLRN